MNLKIIITRLFKEPTPILESILRVPFIAQFIPDSKAIKLFYYLRFRRYPNLLKPKSFNEKLLWLTLHDRKNIYNRMVDKYEAKLYISSLLEDSSLSKDIIVPTLGIYSSFNDIDFSKLPNKFVMKTTHDSGGVVIVKDKSKLNVKTARFKLEKSLKKNYFWFSREWAYKDVKPRILIEKFIESDDIVPPDIKIYCFNGNPLFCLYVSGRYAEVHEDFLDIDWNLLPFNKGGHINSSYKPKRPDCLDKILTISRILSKNCPFLRVDFFIDRNSNLYIGELTLTPASGLQAFNPEQWDYIFGEKLDLSNLTN